MDSKQRVTMYLSQEAMIELRKQAKGNEVSRSAQICNLVLGRSADVTYSPEDMKSFIREELDRNLKIIKDLLNNKASDSGTSMTKKEIKIIAKEAGREAAIDLLNENK